jgi:hypothetical protein
MSFYNPLLRKPGNPRTEHDKAWKRAKATAWDAKWEALSSGARRAYLRDIKPPTQAIATPQQNTLADKLSAKVVDELVAAGFARVEPGVGKKSAKIIAMPATHDFSLRLRSIDRYRLLGPSDRTLLTNYVRHAFHNQGESVIAKVLEAVNIPDYCRLDDGLELYVTTSEWPNWALKAIKTKPAAAVFEALKKAEGPVKVADLYRLVKGVKPKDIDEALTDLITHLTVFEDLQPDTFEIIVGLLPIVRERLASIARSDQNAPLIASENPKVIGPLGGLSINDLRVFLLEITGEAPRLKRDGMLFAKEEPRFFDAFPPLPEWIVKLLKLTPERRLYQAFHHARTIGFTEAEHDDKSISLQLSARGRKWLSSGLEEQYIKFYESFREGAGLTGYNTFEDFDEDEDDDLYDDLYDDYSSSYRHYSDDSVFYGISVSIHQTKATQSRYYSYYTAMDAETRKALRASVLKAFESLPIGVFQTWESVLAHLSSIKRNPLVLGGDLTKLTIFVNQRQVARLPESVIQAARLFVEAFVMNRLLPFDALRPALDNEGKLLVARLPRFAGYFGQKYDPGKEEQGISTKVIVQPDFSILVIGLDPAPAVELAPFCDRSGGHAGQGALTFKISRESVVRGVMQGLNAQAILARLTKYASVDVPVNVAKEIQEWASWVRQVNVRPITVIRCPDSATVDRVVAALGKKAERLGETLAALHTQNLASAERQKLQEQGILITKKDIAIPNAPSKSTAPPGSTKPATPSKGRGRPKKVR